MLEIVQLEASFPRAKISKIIRVREINGSEFGLE